MKNWVIHGDCLEIMPLLPDKCIDMILCDLPYGTTNCKWDSIIPFELLWGQYKRIIKDKSAIVLTASQPFTSMLVMSNLKMFRYEWIWDKVNRYTGALLANKQPMKRHENILVFFKKQPICNLQLRKGVAYSTTRTGGHGEYIGGNKENRPAKSDGNQAKPGSIIEIKSAFGPVKQFHPTQKPVELFEYLIKTYTNEGDVVLDNCAGSGTTGVACKNINRNYILIEKEQQYIDVINKRLKEIKV